MEWFKKIPEWLKAIIALITLIIGFVTFVLDNIYLGITISIAVILISIFLFSLYVAYSKKDSAIIGGGSVYRFQKYHKFSSLTATLTFLVFVALIIIEPTRNFMSAAFAKVSIAQVLIGSMDNKYVLTITVNNTSSVDILITGLEILSSPSNKICTTFGEVKTFNLSDTVIVYGSDENGLKIVGSFNEENGTKQDVKYPVTGLISTDTSGVCYDYVRLDIKTSLILPAKGFYDISVLIPQSLKIKGIPNSNLPLLETPVFDTFTISIQTYQGNSKSSSISVAEFSKAILDLNTNQK